MRLVGIGTDIEGIGRFASHAEALPEGPALRYLTSPELDEAMRRGGRSAEYLASRFAAKEAAMKSLGAGLGQASLKDFEVGSDALGRPIVKLSGRASSLAEGLGVTCIMMSISHGKEYAVAFAAAVAEDVD